MFALIGILVVICAVVGGYLSSHLFGWDINNFSLTGFAVAVGGALILLFIFHLLVVGKKTM